MKNSNSYTQKLKSARKKLGMTQRELAEKLGSSPSAIGMYEQGRRTPDYDTLLKICKILKITAYDVFAENEVINLDVILKALIEYL